ncbi:DUF6777 domain-containing protein [Gordonia shandongensis]|uniref:DUF6777 domain-containing protein n=1 Tax=Gordonia shandongensis TaxID=376351 RepID=UPI00040CBDA6|nr:DUF6777 domain-containing protein [Gordonia shandongensis]
MLLGITAFLSVVVVAAGVGLAGWRLGWFDTGPEAPEYLRAGEMAGDAFGGDFARLSPLGENTVRTLGEQSGGQNSSGEVRGTSPGLYGGTLDELTCDGGGVAEYIAADSGRAAAFSSVTGNRPGDVGDYVTGLTSLVLVHDTWVTDHRYSDGEAVGVPTVLQAGTPVLVDKRGVPRVRCTGASPLSAPDTAAVDPGAGSPPWTDYSSDRVVRVVPGGADVQRFEAVDVDGSGGRVDMPIGIFALDLKGTWAGTATWNTDSRVTMINDNAVAFEGEMRYGTSHTSSDCVVRFSEDRRERNKVFVTMISQTRRSNCGDFKATMTVVDTTMTMEVTEGSADPLTFTKEE